MIRVMPRRAGYDQTALSKLLKRQDQVISRRQALACGMTAGVLRRRTEQGGPWQQLLPRVYLTVTGSPTRDQREIAALCYAGETSLITGLPALRRVGVRVPDCDQVTVLVPAKRHVRSVSYVTIWQTMRMPELVMYRGPIQYALPDRAAADAARETTSVNQIRAVVANALQQRWCTVEGLEAELREGPRRGRSPLRRVLAEVASGVRSVPEGALRKLLDAAGLPTPQFNAKVYAGQEFIARPDAWWPDAGVAVEVDSKEWHLSPDDWQLTMSRHARMSAHGIIVLHFTPRQIRTESEWVIAQIRSALAAGRARPRLALRTETAA
jgi:very-short-patch-repair endonuclease